jgi:hypothetical protein
LGKIFAAEGVGCQSMAVAADAVTPGNENGPDIYCRLLTAHCRLSTFSQSIMSKHRQIASAYKQIQCRRINAQKQKQGKNRDMV